ncbi:MAG: hypothetical protein V8S20_05045 [Candidatus Gastranaerophilaceae bacterium]|jgi:hypothetical protein|nr:hypothetical protein [bacterium]CDE91430.1 unknown [Fusobacterium sp. CAG:815]DAA91476.1 MAG TPA: hypothetical protein CPT93_07895 [Candidatus Gastranaerophilales bacterium HUM_7]DAA92988.1 MAG TPA: hypothetical protein CPT79_02310 [Candidatus Gastranaerophilales bacterium HUM_6]DAB02942.1 MAG TPA: hypothetical protein CPT84_03735 [Candidatus Gastranaerophilales bacterium HUM_12]DAB04940.1 MAG TPA: hypothetical protein CPT78_08255 [Candidatus Gastranaerophilales bacterium HUM_14]
MLEFLFGKKEQETARDVNLNKIYDELKKAYPFDSIPELRKKYLSMHIQKYGYLTYSFQKAQEELTNEETLFALEEKWKQNNVFKNGKFSYRQNQISVLARHQEKNSDWFKKEGHNIKLLNLAALGNGNESKETGKFFDWLKQLLILPSGNLENHIYNTTIYLIPFHPREFGCAYLPKSSEVSSKLKDEYIEEITGLDAKGQVQTFIEMAQLAGHPVIYDILPQTGRFSKFVLANPQVARWYDITELQKQLTAKVDEVAEFLSKDHDQDDIQIAKDVYIQRMQGNSGELSPAFQELYNNFDGIMIEHKKKFSNAMLEHSYQLKIQKRVREIVTRVHEFKKDKQKLEEKDITKQIDTIQALMQEGLWPAPGGAWCSAGVPVYDGMSECGGYPVFKHFDYKGDDVTAFANLDCQTPYYFVNLENGRYNEDVVNLFIENMKKLQQDYNFDGFRVDHIDHIVDEVSEQNGRPISYRAPRYVLNKLNTTMKKKIPYFATLAEYMLWDNFYKEYHEDMKFDVLWGNDIISQFDKTPEKIMEDNQYLTNYNSKFKKGNMLSILKTYNNQDGEFHCIDQYPAQLGETGALYKWAKYKLLPGGKYAQRPMMYADGDESFTQGGLEYTIGEEVSMPRACNDNFFNKFDAIDRFVKNNNIITDGEAQIIVDDEDGFSAWLITKEPMKTAYLVVSNHKYPTEKVTKTAATGENYKEIVEGYAIFDKQIHIPGDYNLKSEYVLNEKDYEPQTVENTDTLHFEKLEPSEFKIFELERG